MQTDIPTEGGFDAVSLHLTYACAIEGNRLHCWGDRIPQWSDNVRHPPPENAKYISLDDTGWCMIDLDKHLHCFSIARNDDLTTDIPTDKVKAVSVYGYPPRGSGFACAIKMDDTLVCWGAEHNNRISNMYTGQVSAVGLGSSFGCAIKMDDQKPICWGDGWENRAPDEEIRAISVGIVRVCGIKLDGTLTCWGDNLPSYPQRTSVEEISVGEPECAIRSSDHKPICWGGGGAIPPNERFKVAP